MLPKKKQTKIYMGNLGVVVTIYWKFKITLIRISQNFTYSMHLCC